MFIELRPIGVIRSPCAVKKETPMQGIFQPEMTGWIELLGRKRNRLKVGGIDVLDNTPLLDIKPYLPRFYSFPQASEGWFTGKR